MKHTTLSIHHHEPLGPSVVITCDHGRIATIDPTGDVIVTDEERWDAFKSRGWHHDVSPALGALIEAIEGPRPERAPDLLDLLDGGDPLSTRYVSPGGKDLIRNATPEMLVRVASFIAIREGDATGMLRAALRISRVEAVTKTIAHLKEGDNLDKIWGRFVSMIDMLLDEGGKTS